MSGKFTPKSLIFPLIKRVIFILILLGVAYYFHLSLIGIICLLVGYMLVMSVIKGTFRLLKFLLNVGLMIALIYIIKYAYQYFSTWGAIIALIVVSVITAIYLLAVQWRGYIAGMQQIERQIWGKTAEERRLKNCKR